MTLPSKTDPIRAALERLVELEARYAAQGADTDMTEWDNAIAAARAALSQPAPPAEDGPAVPEGREPAAVVGEPSDAELLGLDQLEAAWNAQADAANGWDQLGLDEIIVWTHHHHHLALGHGEVDTAPTAEGEVGELVDLIRQIALAWEPDACLLGNMTAKQLARAADLLQHGQSALRRLHRLQQENARFREPERTILCDLLANGTLLPDPDGKRYGVLPAEGEAGEVGP